jgi:hypothetical protein
MNKHSMSLTQFLIWAVILIILAASLVIQFGGRRGGYIKGSNGGTYRTEYINGHKYYLKAYEFNATPAHAGDCEACQGAK